MDKARTIISTLAVVVVVVAGWYSLSYNRLAERPPETRTFTTKSGEVIDVAFDVEAETARLTGGNFSGLLFRQTGPEGMYVNEEAGLELHAKEEGVSIFFGGEKLLEGWLGGQPREETPPETVTDLTSRVWVWQETQLNDGEVITPRQPGLFTLRFSVANSRLSATTDCNSFSGPYRAEASGSLTFGDFATTLMYCENSQEAEFARFVGDANQYLITSDGNLTLLLRDNSGTMTFKGE